MKSLILLKKEKDEDLSKADFQTNKESSLLAKERYNLKWIKDLYLYSHLLKRRVKNKDDLLIHTLFLKNRKKSFEEISLMASNLSVDEQKKCINAYLINYDIQLDFS